MIKRIYLEKDVNLWCVTASTFPDGILAAHEKLHDLFPQVKGRNYFGISYPDKTGGITYKAGAEKHTVDELHQGDSFALRKGTYLYIDIKNCMQNLPAIRLAFEQLIQDSRIDANGVCVEWYKETDCRCMVRMRDGKREWL